MHVCYAFFKKVESLKLKELISGAIDRCAPSYCCWSFVRTVETLNIILVNSVMCACCKLYFCHDLHRKCCRF